MKSVTQAFIDAWNQKQGKQGFPYVQYKRRYFNGTSYVYEANWNQFTLRDFVQIGNITWKLDTPLLNEFKTSNMVLKMKNSDYQFLPSNTTSSIFAPDAIATNGYEPFLTQFRVMFGYKKADGTVELVNLFTGVAIDYIFNIVDNYVEVTVSGNEFLLQSSDAKLVSSPLVNAVTTNTAFRQYTTTATGIAFITNVYDAGVKKVQGIDYTISGTNSFGVGAVITLTYTAIGAITYDGRSWLTLQKIEDLVTLIAQSANILSYSINPVVFPSGSGAATVNIGQFSGTNFSSTWNVQHLPGQSSITGNNGTLVITSNQPNNTFDPTVTIGTPSTPGAGIWTFTMSAHVSTSIYSVFIYFMIDSGSLSGAGIPTGNGYAMKIDQTNTVTLFRITGGSGFQLFAAPVPVTLPGGWPAQHNWTIVKSATHVFSIYVDGIFVGTANDGTYSTSAYFFVEVSDNSSLALTIGNIVNTTAIELTMADFSGMTCYDAVQQLAKLANYEWGFDSTGSMFFRSKAVASSTPVVSINQSDGVSKVLEFHPGYDQIKNDAQVTYEEYFAEYDSSTLPESNPTSQQRFLTQIQQEDYSNFLLAFDPIIAAGRAQNIHDENYRPKRRIRVKSKIIPFLDLSDVLGFSFYNNPRNVDNILGDPLETWGSSTLGTPFDILARNIPGKVIGMILDVNTCTGEYEIQEVLS